jgi:hypothetical protein
MPTGSLLMMPCRSRSGTYRRVTGDALTGDTLTAVLARSSRRVNSASVSSQSVTCVASLPTTIDAPCVCKCDVMALTRDQLSNPN